MTTRGVRRHGAGYGGFVYFIHDAATGLTKIGYSIRPKVRRTTLASELKRPLTILGTVAANQSLEGKLHRVMQATRRHGEWFAPSPMMDACISLCRAVPEGVGPPHFYLPGIVAGTKESLWAEHWFLARLRGSFNAYPAVAMGCES